MRSLLEVIQYNNKSYHDASEIERQNIEIAANKLKTLEHEILQHPEAILNLTITGGVMVSHVPGKLQREIMSAYFGNL